MGDFKLFEDIGTDKRLFKKGESILTGEEKNSSIFVLSKGAADVMYYGPDGDVMRIYRYEAPDFFGELELFGDSAIPMPVVAASDCLVTVVPHERALAALEKDFDACLFVMKRLSEKLLNGMAGRIQLNRLTGRRRHLLAMDAHRARGELHTLCKADLCEELGMPLRSLNRIIAQCVGRYIFENGRFKEAPH